MRIVARRVEGETPSTRREAGSSRRGSRSSTSVSFASTSVSFVSTRASFSWKRDALHSKRRSFIPTRTWFDSTRAASSRRRGSFDAPSDWSDSRRRWSSRTRTDASSTRSADAQLARPTSLRNPEKEIPQVADAISKKGRRPTPPIGHRDGAVHSSARGGSRGRRKASNRPSRFRVLTINRTRAPKIDDRT